MPAHTVPRPPDPAQRAAAVIADGFGDYNARFSDITRRARRRFERRDWKLAQNDNTARIDLYDVCLRETLSRLEGLLEDRVRSRPLWRAIRTAYADRIAALPDRELFKTFYNSLVRRFFRIDGVAPDVEFLAFEIVPTGEASCPGELHHHGFDHDATAVWRGIFRNLAYVNGWADLDASAAAVAEALQSRGVVGVSMLRTPFYRERRAYLVGRAHGASGASYPVVIALTSEATGVRADAVIVDETSMLDSFLFLCLIRAIGPNTQLILVGDSDQLPSVGMGNVLYDLIRSGIVHTEKLTQIYRQAALSRIVQSAHRILTGQPILFNQELDSDCMLVSMNSGADIANAVVRLVSASR